MHNINAVNLVTISDRLRLGLYGSGFKSPNGRLNPVNKRVGYETVDDDDLIALKYDDTPAHIQIAPSGGFTGELSGLTTEERERNKKRATNREEVETDFLRKTGYRNETITGLKTFDADIRTTSSGYGIGLYLPSILVDQNTPGTQGDVGLVYDPTGMAQLSANDIVIYNNGSWTKIADNDGIIVIPSGSGLRLGNLLNGKPYYRVNGQFVEILAPTLQSDTAEILWSDIVSAKDIKIVPAGYRLNEFTIDVTTPFTPDNDSSLIVKVLDGAAQVELIQIPARHLIMDASFHITVRHQFISDGSIEAELINTGTVPVTEGVLDINIEYTGFS